MLWPVEDVSPTGGVGGLSALLGLRRIVLVPVAFAVGWRHSSLLQVGWLNCDCMAASMVARVVALLHDRLW